MGDINAGLPGAALGLIGGIGSIFSTKKSNKELEKLIGQNPSYAANPLAESRLGLAQNLLNARMPYASTVERNIYGTQGGQLNTINQNATDASQALALASGVQGQANQAFQNLGIEEGQDYQRRYGNLANAQEGVINEGDKVYQDQVRKFQDLAAIRGAQARNRQVPWDTISNLGGGLMNFGLIGGFNGMFGNNSGNRNNAGLDAVGMIPR